MQKNRKTQREKIPKKKAETRTEKSSWAIGYDLNILFPVLFLVAIGITMVYSASSALALKKFGADFFFLRKQALFAIAGILILVLCRHIPFKIYWLMSYPLLILSIVLLFLVFIPEIGHSAGGANRWLKIGHWTFQPSEATRLTLVIFMAYSLSKKQPNIRRFSVGFVPHLMVLTMLCTLLLFQPDFGTIFIFCIIAWIMMFVAGVRFIHLGMPLFFILPLLTIIMLKAQYRLDRIMIFWDPWQYPTEGGYQIIHSLMAFGTGGLCGTGIGQSYQKLFYLPEPHTDFIFSVIGEEIGLLGVLLILGMYVWIMWRGILIARNAENIFGSLLATGIIAALALQVTVNMGVALGLLPTKGLTLPFLSYGGTSLLINMAAMGILMNVGGRMRNDI